MDVNGARYVAGTGHYESWFQRANDATGRRAFWIRYTIFSPEDHPEDAVGELWAIAFDRQTGNIVAVKDVVPIAECRFASEGLDVTIAGHTLDAKGLRGEAAANGHVIAWDLTYGGAQPPLLVLPERLYRGPFPRAKLLVGSPNAKFRGSVTVDGELWAIADWVGSQNHNWGSRHTDRYAWGQVCGFDDEPDAFLECSTARLKIGPFWTPWMSPLVFRYKGETIAMNRIDRAIRATGKYDPYVWTIESGDLRIRITADEKDFVALRYANPPGGSKICLNSKIARCELSYRGTHLRSSRAAFEILDDTAPLSPIV
jgi:hypothetical protein